MNYYTIIADVDSFGCYPYVEYGSDSMRKLNPHSAEFKDLHFSISLNNRANLNDIIFPQEVTYAKGLCVSNKHLSFFESVNIGRDYKFYPTKVYLKDQGSDFFFLQIVSDLSDVVNYKESTFVYREDSEEDVAIKVENREDLINEHKNNTGFAKIVPTKLVFLNDEIRSYDLFSLGFFINQNIIVSEKMKVYLEDSHAIGLKFFKSELLSY